MSYTNWKNSRAHLASFADWYEINDLMKALQQLKREHLAGTSSEDFAAAYKLIFVDALQSAPYNEHTRYPGENIFYICDLFGSWNDKLNELRALCSVEKKEPIDDQISDKFSELILEMIGDLVIGKFIFCSQRDFEEWGNVEWVEENADGSQTVATEGLFTRFCNLVRTLVDSIRIF